MLQLAFCDEDLALTGEQALKLEELTDCASDEEEFDSDESRALAEKRIACGAWLPMEMQLVVEKLYQLFQVRQFLDEG